MSELTLQHHRTVWHFVPGLALSAVVTGVALWGGSIPAVAGAGFSALTLAILLGMVVGNTVYPHIWKSCDVLYRPEGVWPGQADQLVNWRRQQHLRCGSGTGNGTGR